MNQSVHEIAIYVADEMGFHRSGGLPRAAEMIEAALLAFGESVRMRAVGLAVEAAATHHIIVHSWVHDNIADALCSLAAAIRAMPLEKPNE